VNVCFFMFGGPCHVACMSRLNLLRRAVVSSSRCVCFFGCPSVYVCECVFVYFWGPVSCGMHVSPQCVASRSGIFKQVCLGVTVCMCVCVCVGAHVIQVAHLASICRLSRVRKRATNYRVLLRKMTYKDSKFVAYRMLHSGEDAFDAIFCTGAL